MAQKQTSRLKERRADRQEDRQVGRKADRQVERKTGWQRNGQAGKRNSETKKSGNRERSLGGGEERERRETRKGRQTTDRPAERSAEDRLTDYRQTDREEALTGGRTDRGSTR